MDTVALTQTRQFTVRRSAHLALRRLAVRGERRDRGQPQQVGQRDGGGPELTQNKMEWVQGCAHECGGQHDAAG